MNECCAPSAGDREPPVDGLGVIPPGPAPGHAAAPAPNLVALPGGAFRMGTDGAYGYAADGEGPAHEVHLAPFSIGRTTVTSAQFDAFVAATGHRTEAEVFGWSFVFVGLLPPDFPDTRAVQDAMWWRQVEGADWAHPEGPGSTWEGREDHPAIHVSWNDAIAYCAWSGTRLPTEAEWEYAARGGLVQHRFPWGDRLRPGGEDRMNVFRGRFPVSDGPSGTVPVGSYAPNGYGLHEVTGNVWEWTADWFDPRFYGASPAENPRGPERGTHRSMRGGSYLCHASYCNRYRVDARSANTPDSSTGNLGFRVARDA